jgi:hypothetical protein
VGSLSGKVSLFSKRVTRECVCHNSFVLNSHRCSVVQGLPFIFPPNTTALWRRRLTSAGTFRDGCDAQDNDKINELYYVTVYLSIVC